MHLNMVNINFTYENTIFHFTNIDYQFHYNRNTIYYIHFLKMFLHIFCVDLLYFIKNTLKYSFSTMNENMFFTANIFGE